MSESELTACTAAAYIGICVCQIVHTPLLAFFAWSTGRCGWSHSFVLFPTFWKDWAAFAILGLLLRLLSSCSGLLCASLVVCRCPHPDCINQVAIANPCACNTSFRGECLSKCACQELDHVVEHLSVWRFTPGAVGIGNPCLVRSRLALCPGGRALTPVEIGIRAHTKLLSRSRSVRVHQMTQCRENENERDYRSRIRPPESRAAGSETSPNRRRRRACAVANCGVLLFREERLRLRGCAEKVPAPLPGPTSDRTGVTAYPQLSPTPYLQTFLV